MLKEVINAKSERDAMTEILVFVLMILISTFILRFTWNNSLSKHITVLKPINTFFDALFLTVSFRVLGGI
tara:strand:+ start:4340 stop:4549 length:210 start_codon:yes stop_codon:yes gene_type:complete